MDVIDAGEKYCASLTGAGIINPVTGKRLVLDPDFSLFYTKALSFYKNWAQKNNIEVWKPKKYWRVLNKDLNIFWQKKINNPAYQTYLCQKTDFLDKIRYKGQEIFEINGVGYVDFSLFQKQQKKKIRNIIIGMEDFIPQKSSSIQNLPAGFENDYDAVFLTEGSLAFRNPFLQSIPWELAKGETMIIRIPDLKEDRFLQDEIFLLPLYEDFYKIGTSYQWENIDFLPSEDVKEQIIDKFKRFCRLPFEIIEHKAGVRPIVKDRKPFLGRVPGFEKLFILNGLGSKGALLAPYCAEMLIDLWLAGVEVPSQWSINRFSKPVRTNT